jgi:hypothetical protein
MLLSSNKEGVGGLAEAGGTASTEPSTRAEALRGVTGEGIERYLEVLVL